MNLKSLIPIFVLLISLVSCCNNFKKEESPRITTIWSHHHSYREGTDTLYLKIDTTNNQTLYLYYDTANDSSVSMIYCILENGDLVVDNSVTIPVSDTIQIAINGDSFDVYKYEYPYTVVGGMGCFVFTKDKGLLGTGLYIGGKKLLDSWNNLKIDKQNIINCMSPHNIDIPPPPTDVIIN